MSDELTRIQALEQKLHDIDGTIMEFGDELKQFALNHCQYRTADVLREEFIRYVNETNAMVEKMEASWQSLIQLNLKKMDHAQQVARGRAD